VTEDGDDGFYFVVTRRHHPEGPILDYLVFLGNAAGIDGVMCSDSLRLAVRYGSIAEAASAARQAQKVSPTWAQTAAQISARVQPTAICWGVASVVGQFVASKNECDRVETRTQALPMSPDGAGMPAGCI
jgi:hypothetical protein